MKMPKSRLATPWTTLVSVCAAVVLLNSCGANSGGDTVGANGGGTEGADAKDAGAPEGSCIFPHVPGSTGGSGLPGTCSGGCAHQVSTAPPFKSLEEGYSTLTAGLWAICSRSNVPFDGTPDDTFTLELTPPGPDGKGTLYDLVTACRPSDSYHVRMYELRSVGTGFQLVTYTTHSSGSNTTRVYDLHYMPCPETFELVLEGAPELAQIVMMRY